MNKRNPGVVATALICFGLIVCVLWVYYGAVFGEEQPEKKKEISVVLYHAGDNGWESLMEGMKQAEDDFSVNINYITAKEDMAGEDQLELVKQAIADGAQGVLVAVGDSQTMYQEVQTEGVPVPIVTLESSTDDNIYTFVSADNVAMGKTLGEEILRDFLGEKDLKVAVVEEYMERDSIRQRAEGLYEALGDSAEIIVLQRNDERIEMPLFLANALKNSDVDAVVALSKETLQSLCEIHEEILADKKVYGIGNTASVVAALDKGKIECLVFQNEFNIGYLSVEALLKEMNGTQSEVEEIDFYCVGKEDIHETQYERLLFPIVE